MNRIYMYYINIFRLIVVWIRFCMFSWYYSTEINMYASKTAHRSYHSILWKKKKLGAHFPFVLDLSRFFSFKPSIVFFSLLTKWCTIPNRFIFKRTTEEKSFKFRCCYSKRHEFHRFPCIICTNIHEMTNYT